jgi:hypothetical protein
MITEEQKRAINAANTHLMEIMQMFDRGESLDDYDFEAVAQTTALLQAEFPDIYFEMPLESEIAIDEGLLSEEEALASAGFGVDESYGSTDL